MAIPDPLPESGLSIPLRASFLVFKIFPLFGMATNNAAPRLVLFNDRIEFRVIASQARRYEELEYIDALQTFGTQNIILCWRRRFFAFSANLGDKGRLFDLLRFFQRRRINLTERAHSILARESHS
ncbi:MAG TPA: hypothetical protein VJQ55_08255 [Candidatus Binatia bacterium]|nr:hypothetical protein [Candidatus Binatia bacterium]